MGNSLALIRGIEWSLRACDHYAYFCEQLLNFSFQQGTLQRNTESEQRALGVLRKFSASRNLCFIKVHMKLKKKNCCLFERLINVKKNGIFLLGISLFALEIFTFFYYANEESDDVLNTSLRHKERKKPCSRYNTYLFYGLCLKAI